MRLGHLIYKCFQKVKSEGIIDTFKEFIYFNRIMIAIEKNLTPQASILEKSMKVIFVNKHNYMEYHNIFNLRRVGYYCKKGAQSCLLFDNDMCIGYQLWTVDSQFKDLKNLDIQLNSNEAYEFDLYVYPKYRGTKAARILTAETDNYLISKGISKIYGFYYSDNVKALWWHRAYLKCKEIKRVKIHRILFFEIVNGKITLNL